MARKPVPAPAELIDDADATSGHFARVVAVIVGLENYRKPKSGDALPTVAYAHADAQAVSGALHEIFKDMPEGNVDIEVMADSDASLAAIKDHLAWTIRNLSAEDLFIFYYAGHGFHGAGGNRLSTYDINRLNIADTTLSMRDALLEPLADSACEQALVFVDACAEHFRDVVQSRDVIANLDAHEVDEFLDSGWYLGAFLSCSPGEKSYPSNKLGHGIWTHFLLEALAGRAPDALTRDRWLTGEGWAAHREALDELFSDEFQQLVVEFDSMDDSFDALVDRLEEIADASGGDVDDDDRHQRVTYSREGARFTFDLEKRRLEIAFGRKSALELVDAAQQFQLGVGRSSPMLATP